MSDIPQFNSIQREFIHQALKAEAPIAKIIDDLMEIYSQFSVADRNIKTTLSDRITKMKARMPEPEKKPEWQSRPHYLSAQWRLAYFRALLAETEDVSLKIRLLGEIRKEVDTIDNHTIEEEPKRKEAYEKKRMKEIVPDTYDPQYLADEDASVMENMKHNNTPLPIKAYEKIEENRYRRKSDDVVVDKEGTPENVGKKTHIEWITEQKQKGLYIYDQKFDAEVIPSPLVLDKDHRDAYDAACKKEWIFPMSVIPKNAYKQITNHGYGYDLYRRCCDGVVVDKLGIPFTRGEKNHHMWLCEQEGIYNYDLNDTNKTQTIKSVLTKEDTKKIKHA